MASNEWQTVPKSGYMPPHMRAAIAAKKAAEMPRSIAEMTFPELIQPVHLEKKPALNYKLMLDESARKREEEARKLAMIQKGGDEALQALGWAVLRRRPMKELAQRLWGRENGLDVDSENFKDMIGYIPGSLPCRFFEEDQAIWDAEQDDNKSFITSMSSYEEEDVGGDVIYQAAS